MSDMLTKIEKKLLEYGFDIYDQYKVEDEQWLFLVTDMVIFVDINTGETNVSFQATTKPDIVANNILILKEIPELDDLRVMDSFIFNDYKQMIRGEEAFELIQSSIENKAVEKYVKELSYASLLNNSDCHEC